MSFLEANRLRSSSAKHDNDNIVREHKSIALMPDQFRTVDNRFKGIYIHIVKPTGKTVDADFKKRFDLFAQENGFNTSDALVAWYVASASSNVRARNSGMVNGDRTKSPLKPPLPDLTPAEIEAVRQKAEKCPWNSESGISPFKWVLDTYADWIPGLLQGHFKADLSLYRAFAKRVSRGGLPDWLDVPTEPEANLRKLSEEDQRKLLTAREVQANRVRQAAVKRGNGLI